MFFLYTLKLQDWPHTYFPPSRVLYSCDISSNSRVHPQGDTTRILPHKPRYSLLSCSILIACLTSKPLFFKQSFTVSIHRFRGLPTERLQSTPLHRHSNLSCHSPFFPHGRTFGAQPFHLDIFFTSNNSLIRVFGTLSILLITSNPLKLSICTA